jgi:hypothetical protein
MIPYGMNIAKRLHECTDQEKTVGPLQNSLSRPHVQFCVHLNQTSKAVILNLLMLSSSNVGNWVGACVPNL